jgi:DnaJ-class molecular chaperone
MASASITVSADRIIRETLINGEVTKSEELVTCSRCHGMRFECGGDLVFTCLQCDGHGSVWQEVPAGD